MPLNQTVVPISDATQNASPSAAGSPEPSAVEIRAGLERILASRCFEQATRSSKFLRFVVEQTLAGQGERLKGYTIAIEVFGRPPDFDAQSDPLVRVEAGRLRRRLTEYYADEGRDDPVRIELPRGRYFVTCSYQSRDASTQPSAAVLLDPMPSEVPGEPESSRNRRRRRWRRIRALLVVAVLLAGFTVIVLQQFEVVRSVRDLPAAAAITTDADGKPPIVVMPLEDFGSGAGPGDLGAALTEEILLLLDRPEIFVVATELSSNAGGVSGAVPAGVGYILSGSVRETGGQVRITARLIRADTGTQIWSEAYDESLDALRLPADQRRVARRIAAVAEPYGPIFDVEVERVRALAADLLRTRDCEVKYYDYRRVLNGERHSEALACFELATTREPGNAEAWAGLSLLTTEAFAYGYAGGGVPASLDRSGEAARKAMDIDGANLHANMALTAVQFFGGADFRAAAERLLQAWPDNAEAQGTLGALFILSGETARGRVLVERALAATPQSPSGYHASTALAELREGRFDAALAAALQIDSPDWPLGHLVVAATAAFAGRADLAARARARLIELHPTIETSLPEVLQRWRVEPVLAEQLQRGFAAAASQR